MKPWAYCGSNSSLAAIVCIHVPAENFVEPTKKLFCVLIPLRDLPQALHINTKYIYHIYKYAFATTLIFILLYLSFKIYNAHSLNCNYY